MTSSALYTHTYTIPAGQYGWVEWNIPSCALEDDEPLWVIVETDYGIRFAETDIHEGNALLVHCSTGWEVISDFSSSYASWSNRMWAIYAVTSATDPGLPTLTVNIDGPTSSGTGNALTFTATGTSGATYSWTLTGATPSTTTATWSTAGTYTVSCTATLGTQTATANHTVTINDCNGTASLPYSEGFEAGFGCWTTIDADGDGIGWMLYSNSELAEYADDDDIHSGNESAMSASYMDSEGALTPDNWLVSPAIVLPNGSATVTWWERASAFYDYAEHYGLYISTTGTATTDLTLLQDYTVSAAQTWVQRTVNLSDYANETVHLALRHWNCTDQYWLEIDDINVTGTGTQGIDEVAGPGVTVSPNPTTGVVRVESAEPVELIEVYGLQGTLLKSAATAEVDLTGLAEGTYLLRVTTASGTATRRVVVQ